MDNLYTYLDDSTSIRLLQTLSGMMEEENIDEISTSSLIQRSGVGRTTFYRKYRSKYDFLNQCYQKLLDNTLGLVSEGLSYKKSFYKLYNVLGANPSFYSNALSSNHPDGLLQYIKNQSYKALSYLIKADYPVMTTAQQLKLKGYVAGTMEITCKWIEDPCLSVEELFRINYDLMPNELQFSVAMYYM